MNKEVEDALYRFDIWVDTDGTFHIAFLDKTVDTNEYRCKSKIGREDAISLLSAAVEFCTTPPLEKMISSFAAVTRADLEAWMTTGELPLGMENIDE